MLGKSLPSSFIHELIQVVLLIACQLQAQMTKHVKLGGGCTNIEHETFFSRANTFFFFIFSDVNTMKVNLG